MDPGTRPLRAGVRGHSHLCDRRYDVRSRGYTMVGGGFAQFISIPAGRLFRYSGHASPEEAALTEPLACCIHSTKRGRIQSEDAVAILGAGTMGALHLLLSKMRGAKVLDRDRARLRLARLASDCRKWGLLLLAEMIPGGFGRPDLHTPENIAMAARLGAEAGADAIKTAFPGSAESFRVRWQFRRFRSGPQSGSHRHVSSPRSSNRACGSPAPGSL